MPTKPQITVVKLTDNRSALAKWAFAVWCVLFVLGIGLGLTGGSDHNISHPGALSTNVEKGPVEGSSTVSLTAIPDHDLDHQPVASPPRETSEEQPIRLITYRVQPGDTLSSIAEKFKTSIESLAYINKLASPDNLRAGTDLTVLENGSGAIRRVSSGDTLWDISKAYGITVEAILAANDIEDPSDLKVGQLLILPGAKLSGYQVQVASVSRSGALAWPVKGPITSGYGYRIHPITGKSDYHQALDIAAPSGTPIRAAASGRVTYAGWQSGYGRLITISHGNGLETRYGHLSAFEVSKGAQVVTGDIIGYVGQSGDATGPHLHFEVRINGVLKNPRSYLP